jgi:hypothetical protein
VCNYERGVRMVKNLVSTIVRAKEYIENSENFGVETKNRILHDLRQLEVEALRESQPGVEATPDVKLADEVTEIRNNIWNLVEIMPMTRLQFASFENIKDRLWNVQKSLRGPK